MNELPNQIASRLKSGGRRELVSEDIGRLVGAQRRTASPKVEPFDTASPREENGG
jgi:hypothetical protein